MAADANVIDTAGSWDEAWEKARNYAAILRALDVAGTWVVSVTRKSELVWWIGTEHPQPSELVL